MTKFYKPYFEAIEQILDGTPVENLEDIRGECNNKFIKSNPITVSKEHNIFSPEAIVVSSIANAENKILMGSDPKEAYSVYSNLTKGHSRPLDDFRQNARKILKDIANLYLNLNK